MGRLDFNLGSKNKMFWNFRHNDRIEDRNNLFKNEATGRDLLRINWGTTLDDVHTFNGTTVANFRLNFSRFREATVSYGDGINGTSLGFPAYVAAASPQLVLPLIRFNSTTAGQDYNQITSDTDSNRPFNIFQVFGDVVKIVGNHSLKMGADAREARDSNQGYGSSQGVYTFGTTWTRGTSRQFHLGAGGPGSRGLPAGNANQRLLRSSTACAPTPRSTWPLFVQDDWRVQKQSHSQPRAALRTRIPQRRALQPRSERLRQHHAEPHRRRGAGRLRPEARRDSRRASSKCWADRPSPVRRIARFTARNPRCSVRASVLPGLPSGARPCCEAAAASSCSRSTTRATTWTASANRPA